MKFCKYCNTMMMSEFETLHNNSYFFFYNCPNCGSVYEGKIKKNKIEEKILEERWFNPSKNKFE